jgi:hypothetical protein
VWAGHGPLWLVAWLDLRSLQPKLFLSIHGPDATSPFPVPGDDVRHERITQFVPVPDPTKLTADLFDTVSFLSAEQRIGMSSVLPRRLSGRRVYADFAGRFGFYRFGPDLAVHRVFDTSETLQFELSDPQWQLEISASQEEETDSDCPVCRSSAITLPFGRPILRPRPAL